MKIRTVGGVIQPGEDLMEIVPIEDNLSIEARIRPADVAFLHPGQDAMVKFTAYDFRSTAVSREKSSRSVPTPCLMNGVMRFTG
ncbi:MAG: HlyD family efflux transporter periplasmic adaptor subunit [Candidatus Sedimenticola endophacoides]